jgi:dipeptidyl aminopeptidase/acylaminoacyl peptidase
MEIRSMRAIETEPATRRTATTLTRLMRRVAPILLVAASAGAQANGATKPQANWDLANKFSTQGLQRVTYGTTVQPRWIGKTDSLWYNWRGREGATFYLVYPPAKVKRPLFDHVKLAAALTTAHRKPYEPGKLPFTTLNFTKDHKAIRFTVDSSRYEWHLVTEEIRSMGRPPRGDSLPPDEERTEGGGGGRGGRGGGRGGGGPNQDFRNFSPDSTAFVFAKEHNLYVVEVGKPDTMQITRDAERNYSFGFRDTSTVQQQDDDDDEEEGGRQGGRGNRDPRVRPNVTWSPDSRAFFVNRNDSREVKELYLVNVLSEPRPTLSQYTYAMPGEENVSQPELHTFHRGDSATRMLNLRKWRDQRLLYTHWTTGSDKLRLVRRDRPQRSLELIEVDLPTGATKTLLTESIESANLESQPPRYVRRGGDLIWFSERTGWGQYYLYAHDGTYKRPLTSGTWRADQVPMIDTIGGTIWVSGVGREPGENVYYRHTYRVNPDGSGFTLLDAGDANHSAALSPTRRYLVDNASRVDLPTRSVIRDASTGSVVMELEQADVAGLEEIGWRPPETFMVKAADGVTDIYGNMWKPFDFDSTRKYPIVAHVYPGPQTESVNTTFNPGGVQQQLAQLGFIVIQIGNRGGSPLRSNAYQSFSYYNLRDYALADKKAGIEQLAARHPWIDLERVGLYGHSGGGFLTAAALMLPPYNDFFKVGVSSSGNHDNNIYNQNWSEQYHGLRTVVARADSSARRRAANGRGGGTPVVAIDTGFVDDSLRYEIKVPTNIELAPNLKGRLLLTTGDMDNNVHPGGTIRLVNALIKANKRFDFMLFPGKAHGYADYQPYFNRMIMEYFAEHLLGDNYRAGAEIR